jgi:hypothetical protein
MCHDPVGADAVALKIKSSIALADVSYDLSCDPIVARAIVSEGFAKQAFAEHLKSDERGTKCNGFGAGEISVPF